MDQDQLLTLSIDTRRRAVLSRQLLATIVASLPATAANVIIYYTLKDISGVPFVVP
jgi:hypothetical protein